MTAISPDLVFSCGAWRAAGHDAKRAADPRHRITRSRAAVARENANLRGTSPIDAEADSVLESEETILVLPAGRL